MLIAGWNTDGAAGGIEELYVTVELGTKRGPTPDACFLSFPKLKRPPSPILAA